MINSQLILRSQFTQVQENPISHGSTSDGPGLPLLLLALLRQIFPALSVALYHCDHSSICLIWGQEGFSFSVFQTCLLFEKKMLVAQSCSILCNLTDCSPPGSSVYGLLQARLPEWVARCFFRASSQPRDQTWVSCTAGRFFTIWATREAHNSFSVLSSLLWPLGFSKKSSSDRGCLLDISIVRYCYSGFIVTCW